MYQEIWKFPLKVTDRQSIIMPKEAKILTIQNQNGSPCLWALVDPKAEKEDRTIEIFGTGHAIRYDMGVSRKYISTFQMEGGGLVFHAFEYTGV